MFGTILSVAFSLMLGYVLWRALSVQALTRVVRRKGLVAASALAWILFVLARGVGHHGTGPLALALDLVGMSLLGSVFLFATAMLAVDIATGFGLWLSRWAQRLRGGALALGCMLTGVALVQGNRPPRVISHEVVLPSLPAALDRTVVIALSDAHLGTHRSAAWFGRRLAQVKALDPDIVVFLGDMFEGHDEIPQELPALGELSAPLGKFYVTGNHDRRAAAGNDALEKAGFRRLQNEWAEAAAGLVIAGIDDPGRRGHRDLGAAHVERALAGRPPAATVLLSHTPSPAARAARAGAELMLSGHTHGGQIWPFGYVVRTVYPLLAGHYEVDGMPIIVCRGTGTWGPPMRLWHRSELLEVTLRAGFGREAGSP